MTTTIREAESAMIRAQMMLDGVVCGLGKSFSFPFLFFFLTSLGSKPLEQ
jgi:hypothetical protein